jgi:hypothetical protein
LRSGPGGEKIVLPPVNWRFSWVRGPSPQVPVRITAAAIFPLLSEPGPPPEAGRLEVQWPASMAPRAVCDIADRRHCRPQCERDARSVRGLRLCRREHGNPPSRVLLPLVHRPAGARGPLAAMGSAPNRNPTDPAANFAPSNKINSRIAWRPPAAYGKAHEPPQGQATWPSSRPGPPAHRTRPTP